MCLTSFQLLRHVKNALIIAVFVICTMLMTLGWKTIDLKVQTVRPYSHIVTSTASGRNVQAQPAVVTKTDHSPKDDSCVNPDVTVLGRPLDICAASEVVKLVEEEDIYFSVKTAGKNNVTRMLPVLLTWFQTVKPNRIHVITDEVSKNDILYQVASKIGIDIVATDCTTAHSKVALCCKSRNEYFRYFNSTKESGEMHKWYCHLDDDMYANIPVLVPALREAMSKSADGGVYFGRWPGEMVPNMPNGLRTSRAIHKKLGFDFKKDLYSKWATGAAYCVSATAMKKVKDILTKHTFEEYCAAFGVSDDVTAAILISMAGYSISDNKMIKTHYDKLKEIPISELPKLITSSHKLANVIEVPDTIFTLEEDKTRFLTYHCLLYPSTSWCKKSR